MGGPGDATRPQGLAGLAPDDGEAVVEKPKGLHRRTFDRLLGRAYAAEEAADTAPAVAMARHRGGSAP